MFVEAYEIASQFTHPLVVARRSAMGEVATSIGAYVILNDQGWCLTAGHVFSHLVKFQEDASAVQEYDRRLREIEEGTEAASKKKQRRKRLSRDLKPETLLRNISPWLGVDGLRVGPVHLHRDVDLAIFKVVDVNGEPPTALPNLGPFPTLRTPSDRGIGSSVMKLGFPFHSIRAEFDEETNSFRYADGALPIPRFPMDGIAARWLKAPDGEGYPRQFIQTSTPGLRGQSGGPLVDRLGTVWGIQISTVHFPLGFSPPVPQARGGEVIEHQFLNVGQAVSTHTIRPLLERHGISAEWSQAV